MTHPIVEAVANIVAEGEPNASECGWERHVAKRIVAEVLRLAREPSNGMVEAGAMQVECCTRGDLMFPPAWRAGIDALLREVEEG